MPKLSQKAIDMPASPIRKLVPYAEAGQNGAELVVWIDSPNNISK